MDIKNSQQIIEEDNIREGPYFLLNLQVENILSNSKDSDL